RVLRVQRPAGGTLSVSLGALAQVEAARGAHPESIAAEDGPNGYDRTCMERMRQGTVYEACLLASGNWPCTADEMQFGVLRRCVPRCSPTEPCKQGHCALFQGERGCIE